MPARIDTYEASGGSSEVIHLDVEALHIEAQDGGYGITWTTPCSLAETVEALAETVPEFAPQIGSLLAAGEGPEAALHTRAQLEQAARFDRQSVRYLLLRLPELDLTWGPTAYWGRDYAEIGLGGEALDLTVLKRLLERTASPELRQELEMALGRVRVVLSERLAVA